MNPRHQSKVRSTSLVAAIATVTVLCAVAFPPTPPASSLPPQADPRVLPRDAVTSPNDSLHDSYSNILPADYVGPEACAECHRTQYDLWLEHPHRCMNQLPSPESVKGDFDDVELRLADTVTRFTSDGGNSYWMTISNDNGIHRRYVVTRTVGSRFMQFYVGRQLVGPEPENHAIYDEHMLPFAYWFKLKRWLPREYFDPNGPEQLQDGQPLFEAINRPPEVRSYSAVCMNCHNTLPYAYRIYHRNYAGFLGATVAAALEPLSAALSESVAVQPTVADFQALNQRLDPDRDLVTLGISCESCHFGGREHAVHERAIRFLPTSPLTRIQPYRHDPPVTDSRDNPRTVLGICVQCHSGTGDYYPNGASKGNSREAIDMHLGACTSQLSCVDCHEPHTASGAKRPGDRPAHVATCTQCHPQFRDPQTARAHSRHGSEARVSCLDCHMPRYVQGLDELVRTHRICLPVEESMVAAAAPNACNLCHLDKSTRWTLDQLRQGWNVDLPVNRAWPSLQLLDMPLGELWLKSPDPALRLLAGQAYAASKLGPAKLPELVSSLNDPHPLNRVFAGFAVSRLLDQPPHGPLNVDVTAPPSERARQIEALLRQLQHSPHIPWIQLAP